MDNLSRLKVLQDNSGASSDFYDGRYAHFSERMAERFNLDITREQWQALNLAIFTDAPTTKWVDMGDTSASSLYTVEYRGEVMLMAFSETAYAIMTVMPRNDLRIVHLRQNSYIQRARSAGDTAFRDQRQGLAADLGSMVVDGNGNLIKPRESVEPEPAAPTQYHPFREALQGFTPASGRPVLSVVPPQPNSTAEDPVVLAAFAKLNQFIDQQEDAVSVDDAKAEEEIAQLEQRIQQIRSGSALATMKRDFLATSRKMAEDAFSKYRDGSFTSEAALSFARLLTAQQAVPSPEPARLSTVREPARIAKGLDGVTPAGPDVVRIRNGHALVYRLDGIEDSLNGWGARAGVTGQTLYNRMNKGATFREALFGKQSNAAS